MVKIQAWVPGGAGEFFSSCQNKEYKVFGLIDYFSGEFFL